MDVQVTWALQHLAAIAALRPDAERMASNCRRAAQILGFVDAQLFRLEATRKFTEQQERSSLLLTLGETLASEEVTTLLAEGATWSPEQALAQAQEV
jgi:hypothetical protein